MHRRPGGRGRRLGIRTLTTVAIATLGVFAPGPAAGAQEETDQPEGLVIEVAGGLDGIYRPGRPAPIDVQIEADQLLTGELEITSRVGRQTVVYRTEIEVPAASRKRFVVPMPTPETERPDITVTLRLDGAQGVQRDVSLESRSDIELVGVLPLVTTAADLPESADLAIDAGTARLFAISPELLGAGFDGLWIFDSIVATNADLDALSSRDADAVLAWTGAGGHLLVDETTGPVPRLPSAWQPTTGRAAQASRGLVRLTDGLAKAGAWDGFLLPTPVDDDVAAGDFDIRRFTGSLPGSLADDLSRDAGFDLPPMSDLLTLFAVYAVVAGPVSYFILRRRGRSTALWVTVPALSVLTTVGVWFVGSELRSNTAAAHATVVLTSEGVDIATTHVLVGEDAGGIATPRGWMPTGRVGDSAYQGDDAEIDIRPTSTGFTAGADLGPGQFTIATARGVVEVAGFTIEATSDDDGRVSGSVTNDSGVTLDHVSVLSGSAGVDLGTLDAGESVPFVLDEVDRFRIESSEWELWVNHVFSDTSLGAGLWNASRQERGGVNATPLGAVAVVGWTDDLDAPVTTRGGDAIRAGKTLIIGRAPIAATGGVPTNMVSRGELVRGAADTGGEADGSGRLSGVYQFQIPESLGDGPLSIHVPRFAVDLDVWQDERWRSVQIDQGAEQEATLSGEGFVVDGLLHVRVTIDSNQIFEFDNGAVLTVTRAAA